MHLRPHGGRQRVRRTHPWVETEPNKGEANLGGGMREAHVRGHRKACAGADRWAIDAANDGHGQRADREEPSVEVQHHVGVVSGRGLPPFVQETHVASGREGTARSGDHQRTQLRRRQLRQLRYRGLHSIAHLHRHGVQAVWAVQRQHLDSALLVILHAQRSAELAHRSAELLYMRHRAQASGLQRREQPGRADQHGCNPSGNEAGNSLGVGSVWAGGRRLGALGWRNFEAQLAVARVITYEPSCYLSLTYYSHLQHLVEEKILPRVNRRLGRHHHQLCSPGRRDLGRQPARLLAPERQRTLVAV